MTTKRLTMAQALILYLTKQYVSRDGEQNPFFAGVWGIFGHGNVAGIGQALQQYKDIIRYHQSRNEQAQVHAARCDQIRRQRGRRPQPPACRGDLTRLQYPARSQSHRHGKRKQAGRQAQQDEDQNTGSRQQAATAHAEFVHTA